MSQNILKTSCGLLCQLKIDKNPPRNGCAAPPLGPHTTDLHIWTLYRQSGTVLVKLSLDKCLKVGSIKEIKCLFPAQADRVVRNWRFIRGIFPNADSNRLSIKRVDGINVPEVYQAISGIGEAGQHGLTLAPFGPKPVSLAMALYAARNSHAPTQTGVYYTQPTYYNSNYSYGIKQIGGEAALNAYCVKLNRQMLYR